MESFFSTVKSELGERLSYGTAKMELFDYIEVFSTISGDDISTFGQISPAAYERQAQAA